MSDADRASDQQAGVEQAPRLGAPFISVAFVTALLFAPLVVATGLLTARKPPQPSAPPDVLSAELRQSLDSPSSSRHVDPDLR